MQTAIREVDTVLSDGEPRIGLVAARAGRAAVDPDRVKQLLLILLANALEYSPPGSPIEVSCTRREHDLVVEVADRGPGIPIERREKVFERFSRLDRGRTGSGAGLGLPIARWIATAHGGSIALLDNSPGLRVRVVLPAAPPSGAEAGPLRTEVSAPPGPA